MDPSAYNQKSSFWFNRCQGPEIKKGDVKMKRLGILLVIVCFVLTVSGLSFAQTPAPSALEKASENAKFNKEDAQSTTKSNADKVKAEKAKTSSKPITKKKPK